MPHPTPQPSIDRWLAAQHDARAAGEAWRQCGICPLRGGADRDEKFDAMQAKRALADRLYEAVLDDLKRRSLHAIRLVPTAIGTILRG